jgi:hypothetical protein
VREEIDELWLPELFNKCYLQVAAMGKKSYFRAAGVSLLNPVMFREIEFETNKETKI